MRASKDTARRLQLDTMQKVEEMRATRTAKISYMIVIQVVPTIADQQYNLEAWYLSYVYNDCASEMPTRSPSIGSKRVVIDPT